MKIYIVTKTCPQMFIAVVLKITKSWRFLKKLKIELLYDPVIALLGIYPKNTKILIQKNI